MHKVGIATVNYNGLTDTLDLLKSLKDLDTKGLETKIFVVDSGSKGDDAEIIKESFPEVEVIKKDRNRGSAGGYNDCAKAALSWGADFILMFNNDVLLKSPKLLKSLTDVAQMDSSIGVVAPKMYFTPGFEFHKEKYDQKDLGNVLWYAGGNFDWNNVMSVHLGIDEVDSGKYDSVEEVEFTNITCILVKAEVFKKGIFFDEKLFAYFDDNDWSQKVVAAGFKKYYDGRVAIYHKVSRTSGIGSPISDYYITRNRLFFGMRYCSLRTKAALIRQAITYLISGRPAQKQAVWDFLRNKGGEYEK
jgi:hypothetical protein